MKRIVAISFILIFIGLSNPTLAEKVPEDVEVEKSELEVPEVIIQGEEEEDNKEKETEEIKNIEIDINEEIEKDISDLEKINEKEEESALPVSRNQENNLYIGAGNLSSLLLKGFISRSYQDFELKLTGAYQTVEKVSEGDSLTTDSFLLSSIKYSFSEYFKLFIDIRGDFKTQEYPELENLSSSFNMVGTRIIAESNFEINSMKAKSVFTLFENYLMIKYPREMLRITPAAILPDKLKLNHLKVMEDLTVEINPSIESIVNFNSEKFDDYHLISVQGLLKKKTQNYNFTWGILVDQFKTDEAHSRVFPLASGQVKLSPEIFLEFKYNPGVEFNPIRYYYDSEFTYFNDELYPVEHIMRGEFGLKNIGYLELKDFEQKTFYMLSFNFFADKMINFYYPLFSFENGFQFPVNAPVFIYGIHVKNSYVFSDNFNLGLDLVYNFKDNQEDYPEVPGVQSIMDKVYGYPDLDIKLITKYDINEEINTELVLNYIGKMEYFPNLDPYEEIKESYLTGNLNIKYQFNPFIIFNFEIQNLTNTHYHINSSMKNSGIRFLLGFNLVF